MTKVFGTFIGAVCLTSLAACSAERKPVPPAPASAAAGTTALTPGGAPIEAVNQVTITATVVAIDHKKRLVTLKGPEGKTETFRADDRVKNLPQVRKGDIVVVTYYESIAVRLRKPGAAAPGVTSAEGLETAAPGQMPAGVGARTVTVTATVQKIDRKKQTVTLKGPRGKMVTVAVRDPNNLAKVQEGDLVEVTYTEALAIAVEKAAKK